MEPSGACARVLVLSSHSHTWCLELALNTTLGVLQSLSALCLCSCSAGSVNCILKSNIRCSYIYSNNSEYKTVTNFCHPILRDALAFFHWYAPACASVPGWSGVCQNQTERRQFENYERKRQQCIHAAKPVDVRFHFPLRIPRVLPLQSVDRFVSRLRKKMERHHPTPQKNAQQNGKDVPEPKMQQIVVRSLVEQVSVCT